MNNHLLSFSAVRLKYIFEILLYLKVNKKYKITKDSFGTYDFNIHVPFGRRKLKNILNKDIPFWTGVEAAIDREAGYYIIMVNYDDYDEETYEEYTKYFKKLEKFIEKLKNGGK